MKNMFFSVFLLFTVVMYNSSCKKQETVPETTVQVTGESVPPGFPTLDAFRNDAIRTYAGALAKAMNSEPQLRSWIKSKALLQFDGDYDILHTMVKNEEVLPGISYAQLLSVHSGRPIDYFLNDLPVSFPTLNIMVPEIFEPETWETASFSPGVVAVPVNFDDSFEQMLPVYTHEGATTQVSSLNEPGQLMLCVAQSERVLAFSQPYSGPNSGALHSDHNYMFFRFDQVLSDDGIASRTVPAPGNSNALQQPPLGTEACDRDNSGKKDIMHAFKVNDDNSLKTLESWINGKVELYFYVLYNGNANTPNMDSLRKQIPDYKRKSLKNGAWKTHSLEILKWENQNVYGNKMKYAWFEYDGGKSRGFTISLTLVVKGATVTISTTVPGKDQDDNAGESIVEYCDRANWGGSDYNTGIISFNVRI